MAAPSVKDLKLLTRVCIRLEMLQWHLDIWHMDMLLDVGIWTCFLSCTQCWHLEKLKKVFLILKEKHHHIDLKIVVLKVLIDS